MTINCVELTNSCGVYNGVAGRWRISIAGGDFEHAFKRFNDAKVRAYAQSKVDPEEHLANAMLRRLSKIKSAKKAAALVVMLVEQNDEFCTKLAQRCEAWLRLTGQELE